MVFPRPLSKKAEKGKRAFGEAILFAAFLGRGPEIKLSVLQKQSQYIKTY